MAHTGLKKLQRPGRPSSSVGAMRRVGPFTRFMAKPIGEPKFVDTSVPQWLPRLPHGWPVRQDLITRLTPEPIIERSFGDENAGKPTRRYDVRVLVAERGARLGNFAVVDVTPGETWVTVAEWMQP